VALVSDGPLDILAFGEVHGLGDGGGAKLQCPCCCAAAGGKIALLELHTGLGAFAFMFSWDWVEAERELRTAIELRPSDRNAHELYGFYLLCMGQLDEARKSIQRAHELDPFSHNTLGN
jgi:tetratricopeptide (TPR) repeat protein